MLNPNQNSVPIIKQVFVTASDLNMRKGKLAAQVAHGCTLSMLDRNNFNNIKLWISQYNMTKIVLGANSIDIIKLYDLLKSKNIPVYKVIDAGKTEFHNVPTLTCICIGPCDASLIDPHTVTFKLI